MSHIKCNDSLIKWLSLIVSITAVIISVYTCRRHSHQLLEDKQVDAVVEMVQYMQDCRMALFFNSNGFLKHRGKYQIYSLFELSDTTIRSDMDNEKIYFSCQQEFPFDFTSFANNPLIPSTISTILDRYFLLDVDYCSSAVLAKKTSVIISCFQKPDFFTYDEVYKQPRLTEELLLDSLSYDINSGFYFMPNVPALRNFGSFKKCNMELYDAIVNWFHEKGMDNVNIPRNSRLFERKIYRRYEKV